jgi:sporulation protein YlmC with PRC-barrel domain
VTPDARIKLVSELLDLPLIDSEGRYCGIVDDVEFSGEATKLKLKALLVGPGAYQKRMPAWLFWIVRKIAGDRLTRVPIERIRTIGSAVKLKSPGGALGLQQTEVAAERWIPRWGAM